MFDSLITKMQDKAWRDDITAKLKGGLQAIMSVIKSVVKIFETLAPVLKFVADNFALVASVLVATKLPAIIAIVTTVFQLIKVSHAYQPNQQLLLVLPPLRI